MLRLEIKSKGISFRELIYDLFKSVKHRHRNYEQCSKKTSIYGVLLTKNISHPDGSYLAVTGPYCRIFSRTTVLNSSENVSVMTTKKSKGCWGWNGIVFSTLEETKET